jgi:hypothetical protein
MMHLAMQTVALVRLGGDKVISGGVFPLLLIAAVVGVAAWAMARHDTAKS